MSGLFKAVSERQQLLLAESSTEEGDSDRQVVAGESCGYDEIGKAGEVRDSRRRIRAAPWRVGKGTDQSSAARSDTRSRPVFLIQKFLQSQPAPTAVRISDRRVLIVIQRAAAGFTFKQTPAARVWTRAICTRGIEAIGTLNHFIETLWIAWTDRSEIIRDLRREFGITNRVIELALYVE